MSDEQEQEQQTGTIIEQTEYTDEEMNALIDGTMTDFDDGDLVHGTIVRVERDEVLLDIGYKSEGVIPARELSIRKDANPADIVSVGDEVEALVLQKEDKDGRLILSKKRAEYERAWSKIEEKFESGEIVEGEIIEVVKGGLILDIGLRGFLPASLVDLRRVKDLTSFLGQRLEARVIEMDRNRNNVVLSRRVVLEEGRKHERAEILGKLQKGMILPGHVSSIVDFGAFVDLGGIDGLVHISELSWSHVNHPSEVVKVGDPVNVQVLDVDLSRERISLGLKQTTEDPWKQLVKNFPIGSIIEGKVTKLVPFGVFVELGDGVEGLVHISEMAKGHVETPDQVAKVGDTVHVKVMDVDEERRRISLSMRSAAETLGFEIEIQGGSGELEEDAEEGDEASDTEDSDEATEVVAVMDTDGDGEADTVVIAADLDGDGEVDVVEVATGVDTDGDGEIDTIITATDLDGDGEVDVVEVATAVDTDGDGEVDTIITAIDLDGDGEADIVEIATEVDTDGDGETDLIVTSVDLDGDGEPDIIEVVAAVDTDGDGVADAIVEAVEVVEGEEAAPAEDASTDEVEESEEK
jgi:small subunit ribosomal protein S1